MLENGRKDTLHAIRAFPLLTLNWKTLGWVVAAQISMVGNQPRSLENPTQRLIAHYATSVIYSP